MMDKERDLPANCISGHTEHNGSSISCYHVCNNTYKCSHKKNNHGKCNCKLPFNTSNIKSYLLHSTSVSYRLSPTAFSLTPTHTYTFIRIITMWCYIYTFMYIRLFEVNTKTWSAAVDRTLQGHRAFGGIYR